MRWFSKERRIHEIFEGMLIYKSIHALVQLLGGIALFFAGTSLISRIAVLLTRGELLEDPQDKIATFILHTANSLSVRGQVLFGIYLVIHGALNMFLSYGLWKRKAFVYPFAASVFALICGYQIYLYALHGSIILLFLSAIDISYIWLILHEYRKIKESSAQG